MALTAPRPGSSQWDQAWRDAWKRANPGKPAPWEGTSPGVGFGPGTTRVPNSTNPTPQRSQAPWETDPLYQGQQATGRNRLTNTLAGIENEQNVGLARLGVNAQGVFDPTNPFSQAALLKRNYDQSVRGTTNSMAARGQLYSGALQRQQRENRFGFEQGHFDLNRQFDALMNSLIARRRAAQDDFDQLGVTGRAEAIARALGGY